VTASSPSYLAGAPNTVRRRWIENADEMSTASRNAHRGSSGAVTTQRGCRATAYPTAHPATMAAVRL